MNKQITTGKLVRATLINLIQFYLTNTIIIPHPHIPLAKVKNNSSECTHQQHYLKWDGGPPAHYTHTRHIKAVVVTTEDGEVTEADMVAEVEAWRRRRSTWRRRRCHRAAAAVFSRSYCRPSPDGPAESTP